ncbi:hypothetical protein MRB53_017711 [Persea americana]|uniref:Uncharacterized protein n=1 Tax=Persea americana TaxID=3435 RepID=A0ACC2M5U4_PERAE|nr:hypothetical protein MRB53_017711 [Persea americana]
MDFMKVIDQTVREIKREVNMKVLKVPELEQKVLDATSDEPWGPHGSALSEIAQATKKFTECQMIMNVLWTRLTDTGRNWRHVYKALAVVEYLLANGSERAMDDILEHSFQISSLSGFEYVEPNGKDMGINVRKKVGTIMTLLNDKDKIQEVRNKAAANRDKYFGLSSTGISYKSSSASYGSSSYGGSSGSKDSETFKGGFKDRDQFRDETEWNHGNKNGFGKDGHEKTWSQRGLGSENEENYSKKGSANYGRDKDDNYGPVPSSQSSSKPSNSVEDDFDDFDPRGSSNSGQADVKSNNVDLFGDSLIDLMDAPTSVAAERTTSNASDEVDLFADATFVSAAPHAEAHVGSNTQANVDLFAQSGFSGPSSTDKVDLFAQSAYSGPSSSTVDLFAASDPPFSAVNKTVETEPTNPNVIDPFANMPLNNFETSDVFGDFTSHTNPVSTQSTQNSSHNGVSLNQNTTEKSRPPQKKETFQVKSGIWADTLSRGLIDLNISAPKKVSLANIGIVGGLSDGSDEKEKVLPSSAYMGRSMGIGSGLGGTGAGANFTNPSQYQFGSFK